MDEITENFVINWKKGLKRAYIQMLIVFTLFLEDECTGYVVTEQIKNRLGGDTFKISAGTIYPQLNRLERDGIITSEIKITKMAEIRPKEPRKMFKLTAEGQNLVLRVQKIWIELVTTVNSYIYDIDSILKERE